VHAPDPLNTTADRIWADLLYNRGFHPTRRRYSGETLVWGRETCDILAAAYQIISQILPLPGDRYYDPSFCTKKLNVAKRTGEQKGLGVANFTGKSHVIAHQWSQCKYQNARSCGSTNDKQANMLCT
jgi:hypothetical protein